MLRIQASFSQAVKEKFDQRTAYEHNNLLHPRFAAKVVAQTKLQEGWKVLDLACGTGLVTYAAGKAVGPEGTVLGLDISPVMLQQAEAKRTQTSEDNIIFQEADIEDTDFPNNSFDAILCASALPYIQNIEKALEKYRGWLRKSGGVLSYNSPKGNYTPLIPLMAELLQKRNIRGWKAPMWNMADASVHEQLLRDAGFQSFQVSEINDANYGLHWPLSQYAEKGWSLMMGFNMWFCLDTLLTEEELQHLRSEFIPRAEEIGRGLANAELIVEDAKSFVFAVGKT